MIRINNYNQKRILEGSCYSIKRDVLSDLINDNVEAIVNSYVIGLTINLLPNSPKIFHQSKSFSSVEIFYRNFNINGGGNFDQIPIFNENKYTLVIKNVGQGNWNEIYSNDYCSLIYDIGTSMFYSKDKVLEISSDRIDLIKNQNPVLVISHWDIDHYHCLFSLETDIIKSFSYIICPSFVPTLSSRIILSKFVSNCFDKLITFELDQPLTKKKYNPLLSIKKSRIIFFFGYKHRDRNKSGIIIAINLKNKGAILAGDHFYNQISNCVLPEILSKEHCLVVPHHGGNAGKMEYNLKSSQFAKEAIISVGLNYYGHPIESVIEQLKKIGFKVYQTRFTKNDIRIDLN